MKTTAKKNFKYRKNQIGGIQERIADLVGRELNEDELRVLDYIIMPSLVGRDQYGSFDRARNSFNSILNACTEKAAEFDAMIARINSSK